MTTAIPYLAKDPQVTTATTAVAALPAPLDGAAAAVVGDAVFLFGGAGSNAIWEYRPGANEYTSAGTVEFVNDYFTVDLGDTPQAVALVVLRVGGARGWDAWC